MTAVLAQVHEVVRTADDDLDLALATCPQFALGSPVRSPAIIISVKEMEQGGRNPCSSRSTQSGCGLLMARLYGSGDARPSCSADL